MTKNASHKKAARAYQQEHPGTSLPDALRATKRGECFECGKGSGHFMDCSQHPDFDTPEVRAEVIPKERHGGKTDGLSTWLPKL